MANTVSDLERQMDSFQSEFRRVHQEISKVIVGYSDVIDDILMAILGKGQALLEAMQEKTVTVGKQTYRLELPFVVLATLNPLELEATYPLPEAQLDRFFIKLRMNFPGVEDIHTILDRTTYLDEPSVERVWDAEKILQLREVALAVPISEPVQDYAIRIVMATQPTTSLAHEQTKKYLRYGASPRGAQALIIGGKVRALLSGRSEVACEDIRHVVLPALRHRVILNFEGEAERIDPDAILEAIIEWVTEKR